MLGQIFKIENTSSLLALVSRCSSSLVGVCFKNSGFVVLISSTLCGLFWGFFVLLLWVFMFCFAVVVFLLL